MDYRQWYSRISQPFRSPGARRVLRVLDKALAYGLAIAYLGSLLYLACTVSPAFWKAVLVPLIAYGAVTALRQALDMPRPAERHGIEPVLDGGRSGCSFPSRHMASAVIIAMELQWLWPLAAIPAWTACLLVAFTRVVGGRHQPRDIVAALVLSGAIGLVGFYLVP